MFVIPFLLCESSQYKYLKINIILYGRVFYSEYVPEVFVEIFFSMRRKADETIIVWQIESTW